MKRNRWFGFRFTPFSVDNTYDQWSAKLGWWHFSLLWKYGFQVYFKTRRSLGIDRYRGAWTFCNVGRDSGDVFWAKAQGFAPRLPHFSVSPNDLLWPAAGLDNSYFDSRSLQFFTFVFPTHLPPIKLAMESLCLLYHLQVFSWGAPSGEIPRGPNCLRYAAGPGPMLLTQEAVNKPETIAFAHVIITPWITNNILVL